MIKKCSFLIVLVFAGVSFAKDITCSTMVDLEKVALEKAAIYGAANVLLVFDNDNTLLTMTQDLGSNAWWDWQSGLLFSKKEKKPGLVADNFNELLDIQGLLFSFGKMKPVESMTVHMVQKLQDKGFQTFVHTARGPGFYYSTLRELLSNGLLFEGHLQGSEEIDSPQIWAPYDPKTVAETYGFTEKEFKAFKLHKKSRPVAFSRGVFFTAGQHKGAMLRILLHKIQNKPKAIVFIDDGKKNTQRVSAAYVDSQIDMTTIRYAAKDKDVERFHRGDKKQINEKWNSFEKAYQSRNLKKISKFVKKNF